MPQFLCFLSAQPLLPNHFIFFRTRAGDSMSWSSKLPTVKYVPHISGSTISCCSHIASKCWNYYCNNLENTIPFLGREKNQPGCSYFSVLCDHNSSLSRNKSPERVFSRCWEAFHFFTFYLSSLFLLLPNLVISHFLFLPAFILSFSLYFLLIRA